MSLEHLSGYAIITRVSMYDCNRGRAVWFGRALIVLNPDEAPAQIQKQPGNLTHILRAIAMTSMPDHTSADKPEPAGDGKLGRLIPGYPDYEVSDLEGCGVVAEFWFLVLGERATFAFVCMCPTAYDSSGPSML